MQGSVNGHDVIHIWKHIHIHIYIWQTLLSKVHGTQVVLL